MLVRLPFWLYKCTLFVLNTAACAPSFFPFSTPLRPFQVQRRRPQLRLVLSSATLQARALADFFQPTPQQVRQAQPLGAPVLEAALVSVEGQLHPVRVHYLEEPCRDYLQQAVATALEIHATQRPGDVLVFLTGQVRDRQEWRWLRRTSEEMHHTYLLSLPTCSEALTMSTFKRSPNF
jgi:ATP-dependent RNA helicase DDX35